MEEQNKDLKLKHLQAENTSLRKYVKELETELERLHNYLGGTYESFRKW